MRTTQKRANTKVMKVGEEGEIEKEGTEVGEIAEQSSWSIVSPAKVGRSGDKQQQIQTVGSPSRFAVLETEEEEDKEEKLVEEKLMVETSESENLEESEEEDTADDVETGNLVNKIQSNIRTPPPWVGKGTHKYLEENFNLATRDTLPSVSSKRKPKHT